MSTTTQHGATQPGDKSEIKNFKGTEGILEATQLAKQIRQFLGTSDSEEFLTTSKEDILAKIQEKLADQPSLLYKEETRIKDRLSECYWIIRSWFATGSTADAHFTECDEAKDIPALWKIFQKEEYLGCENSYLAGTISEQLFDSKAIIPNPLDEFSRILDLERKTIIRCFGAVIHIFSRFCHFFSDKNYHSKEPFSRFWSYINCFTCSSRSIHGRRRRKDDRSYRYYKVLCVLYNMKSQTIYRNLRSAWKVYSVIHQRVWPMPNEYKRSSIDVPFYSTKNFKTVSSSILLFFVHEDRKII